jgi:hypothetical protein
MQDGLVSRDPDMHMRQMRATLDSLHRRGIVLRLRASVPSPTADAAALDAAADVSAVLRIYAEHGEKANAYAVGVPVHVIRDALAALRASAPGDEDAP